MNRLVLISCCWLLKKTLVITTNLTNPEPASGFKKIYFHCLLFFFLSIHQTTKKFFAFIFAFIKATLPAFVISITCAFNVDLLANFYKVSKFDWFLWTLHSTLLTACADQLLYSLNLIKWCSACIKQNTTVKTLIDACSLLAKKTLSDLVGKRSSLLIINFKQVFIFWVWNIYFIFFLSVVDCTFYKKNIQSNCVLLLCHVGVRSSRQEVFCKKGVLKNFAKFTGKHLF